MFSSLGVYVVLLSPKLECSCDDFIRHSAQTSIISPPWRRRRCRRSPTKQCQYLIDISLLGEASLPSPPFVCLPNLVALSYLPALHDKIDEPDQWKSHWYIFLVIARWSLSLFWRQVTKSRAATYIAISSVFLSHINRAETFSTVFCRLYLYYTQQQSRMAWHIKSALCWWWGLGGSVLILSSDISTQSEPESVSEQSEVIRWSRGGIKEFEENFCDRDDGE